MARQFYREKIPENFVLVEGGTFIMGSKDEGTPHEVALSGFLICKHQVTQAKYVEITGKSNPSYFKGNDENPVENISWFDAIKYCNLLSKKYGFAPAYDGKGNLLDAAGKITADITKVRGFRLPTEAEWEYAARGGNQSKGYEYSGSNNIKEVAWHDGNSGKKTHPVGTLNPNELGLYDMSGNVWEWCHDWYGDKYYDACKSKGTVQNPLGPEKGSYRVLRGGSWISGYPQYCRVAYRSHVAPDFRDGSRGFRLAASLSSQWR